MFSLTAMVAGNRTPEPWGFPYYSVTTSHTAPTHPPTHTHTHTLIHAPELQDSTSESAHQDLGFGNGEGEGERKGDEIHPRTNRGINSADTLTVPDGNL